MASAALYKDQQAWQDLQEFLPERLRLDETSAPDEEFWGWRGHGIHLDRYRRPEAKARVILHHGVGTNGRQMSLILGAPLARQGYDVVALDNLGYGMTRVESGYVPSYADWVDMVIDFLAAEQARDPKPTVLYGLSAGGMLAYHVAAKASPGALRGIVGMTFLDQRHQEVVDRTARSLITARVGMPWVRLLARTPLRSVRYPMRLASKMSALANNPGAMKVFLADQTSAGNAMWLRFLADYATYVPAVEPVDFDACPVLLTQPGEDRWTPRDLSDPVVSRLDPELFSEVILDRAGHFPLEEPGLQQLEEAVVEFVERVRAPA
ncbi:MULTISPECIES: alpha/beta hydrolase [Brevibacterium]|uniref:Alpha/beta fold hydrolase n=1 Tax=Brevibacterium casei TaxID=33889 RepID=A0A7T2TIN8_9MICO|nr:MULTISPECIES: alpha/beta fold hydrolase [Brevibacterium]MCM1013174.1 alpha/beta fold hydrolase [Brevibacterium sp. XM4083]QPS34561.1 alpha/beta fold hydrolase [Brevibacterium casei]